MFCFTGLNNVGIYLRDESFESDTWIIDLHPTKWTHWVTYINEKYLDSYGCVCPKKLSKFIIKRNGCYLYSGYQNKKVVSFCASYCLFIL